VAPPEVNTHMSEATTKSPSTFEGESQPTVIGRTIAVQGQLSAEEDLLIDGRFDGTINLDENCLTVGTNGQVKAEIRARQVVVLGAVIGNLSASDKIEIRRTGHVVGDLLAAKVAIEEGAYFKGSVDIVRSDGSDASREVPATNTMKTTV
jgi:cytoskeletal protein CcmA (bactofilin family)